MKWTYGTMIIMALLLSTTASATLVTEGSSLEAVLLNYQPAPANPGDELEVWIQLQNNGGSASGGGTLTIIDSGPFSVESEADRKKEFQSIPPQNSLLIKTRIRIDKDAHQGDNDLVVRIQESGAGTYIEQRLTIPVEGESSALSILSARTTPERIPPGGSGTLELRVKNIGSTELRNVKMTLDFTDLSMAPTGSSNSMTIDQLGGGEEHTYRFEIVTYPDATTQAYQLPLEMSYYDEEGTAVTQEETVGVVIGAEPELLIYLEKVGATKESKQGTVVIKFVNKGLSEIKLLEMELLENDDVTVTSESGKVYVGNIATDDYETADLELKVTKSSVLLPLKITYKDSLNRPYTQTVDVPMTLRSANGKSGSGWIVWLILVVVAGAGVWFFVARRDKRAK